jgi:hypothetical protein
MLARPPGEARECRTNKRSPPAAGFTPPGLRQRGSVPSYAGSERARRAAHRGHISQRRAVTARGPRPALSLRSAPALHTYHRSAKDTPFGLGRPVRRGSARLPVTRPRCHRRTVPGVTSRCARSRPGRSLISAASTARWAQSHRAPARCGAAPRPRTAPLAVPHPSTPANDPAGQASQQAARRSDRADATTRPVIMPSSHVPITPGHSHRPASGTPQAEAVSRHLDF